MTKKKLKRKYTVTHGLYDLLGSPGFTALLRQKSTKQSHTEIANLQQGQSTHYLSTLWHKAWTLTNTKKLQHNKCNHQHMFDDIMNKDLMGNDLR